MQPDTLDFCRRAELAELMDEPCSREELRGCLRDIARLNRWFLAYRPVLTWLNSLGLQPRRQPIRLIDVGCGYGDGLRRIEQWAQHRGVCLELTGCDLNPNAVAIAAEASPGTSRIDWIAANVFHYDGRRPVDIIVSSQFTHHLKEEEIVRFLLWMEEHARIGWFISDLSRSATPYRLLKVFSKAARLHPFVQHDGPASIARAFVIDDWRRMCAAAGLNGQDVNIEAFRPARLCVGRIKP